MIPLSTVVVFLLLRDPPRSQKSQQLPQELAPGVGAWCSAARQLASQLWLQVDLEAVRRLFVLDGLLAHNRVRNTEWTAESCVACACVALVVLAVSGSGRELEEVSKRDDVDSSDDVMKALVYIRKNGCVGGRAHNKRKLEIFYMLPLRERCESIVL